MDIRESQVEDILVGAPSLTRSLLNLDETPRLLARQMPVPSGRIDLLYAHRSDLLLLELKVVPFRPKHLEQVLQYAKDLTVFQDQGKLIKGGIRPYLLVPAEKQIRLSSLESEQAVCVRYDPAEVLRYFYDHFKPVAMFTQRRAVDVGIWNIHLIHSLLYALAGSPARTDKLTSCIGCASRTLYNKIKFAGELRLVHWKPHSQVVTLTDAGREYCKLKDTVLPSRMSEEQASFLRDMVMRNPYESGVILGIASAVEAVFVLAKNSYPVSMPTVLEFFTLYAGKVFDWKTTKARYNGTRMYTNYAIDLGLLGSAEESLYLTPEGFRFTMQMQLHKGIKLVEAFKLA